MVAVLVPDCRLAYAVDRVAAAARRALASRVGARRSRSSTRALRDDAVPVARAARAARRSSATLPIVHRRARPRGRDPTRLRRGGPLAASRATTRASARRSASRRARSSRSSLLLRRVSGASSRRASELDAATCSRSSGAWTTDRPLVVECVVAVLRPRDGRARRQARRDPLTGLLNHQAFHDALGRGSSTAPALRRTGSRSSSSTSTDFKAVERHATAIRRATASCVAFGRRSRPRRCADRTSPGAWAATSSRSCCSRPTATRRARSCARLPRAASTSARRRRPAPRGVRRQRRQRALPDATALDRRRALPRSPTRGSTQAKRAKPS